MPSRVPLLVLRSTHVFPLGVAAVQVTNTTNVAAIRSLTARRKVVVIVRADAAQVEVAGFAGHLFITTSFGGAWRPEEVVERPIYSIGSGPSMAPMPPLPDRKPQRSVAQQIASHEPVSEYARRPAPQGLDVHGRPAPVAAAPQGDDHLDIPAFLRRQSN